MRAVLLSVLVWAVPTSLVHAAPVEREVRAAVEQFVAAQNAHDLAAVGRLLIDSPDFLWITRGTPVWGRADALDRFRTLYAGTWHLEPDWTALRIVLAKPPVAQVFVPITFTIGAPDQTAQDMPFLMNLVFARTGGEWKVSSILPIPVPVAPKR